jgi:hypothetical protein
MSSPKIFHLIQGQPCLGLLCHLRMTKSMQEHAYACMPPMRKLTLCCAHHMIITYVAPNPKAPSGKAYCYYAYSAPPPPLLAHALGTTPSLKYSLLRVQISLPFLPFLIEHACRHTSRSKAHSFKCLIV